MSDCIFCKIANGEIPAATLYENEDFRAILDLGPATKGHTLIIPKKHYDNVLELPDELAGKAMILARKLAVALKEGLHADGVQLVQNNGKASGQTVFHFHMHIIPRYSGDRNGVAWVPGELTEEVKQEVLFGVRHLLD